MFLPGLEAEKISFEYLKWEVTMAICDWLVYSLINILYQARPDTRFCIRLVVSDQIWADKSIVGW